MTRQPMLQHAHLGGQTGANLFAEEVSDFTLSRHRQLLAGVSA